MAAENVEPVEGPSLAQRVAQACVYLAFASVGVTFIGLMGLAAETRPYGRMLLTLGIVGGTVALVVTAAASAVDDRIAGGDSDDDDGRDPTHPY